jgi:hypothetical protein
MDALFQTLIGGFLALAGAFVAPYFQRKHERWIARRADHQTLRQKAEELFSEIDTLASLSGRASVRIVEQLMDDSLETIPLPDLGRIRALSTVYFPKLLPHLDRFQADIKKSNADLIPQIRQAGDALDADKIRGIGVIMVIEHRESASKLAQAVHHEMREISPKFEGDL